MAVRELEKRHVAPLADRQVQEAMVRERAVEQDIICQHNSGGAWGLSAFAMPS